MNANAMNQLRAALVNIEADMETEGSRELSLARTELELSIYWLKRAYRDAGLYMEDV